MRFSVTVTDYDTQAPIKGASVSFSDYDGEIINVLTTDAQGKVYLDDQVNQVEVDNGGYSVEAPGYYQVVRFGGSPLLIDGEFVDLRIKERPKIPVWLLLGAGAGLLAITQNRKTKKVSGIDPKAVTPWIAPVVGVTVVGVLVYKIGQKFGIFDDAEEKRRKAEAAQRENDFQKSMDQICSAGPASKPNADFVAIADALEHALDSAGYLQAYRDQVVYECCKAKNDCDVQKMIYYFGHRQLRNPFLIKSGDYTLSTGINERLNVPDIATINDNYARKYIKFRW